MSRCKRLIFCSIAAFAALAGVRAHAAIPASERNALIDLYNSADGADWIYSLGWNGSAGTECGNGESGAPAWFGVTCDSTNSHVIGIYLVENNLGGSLPASLNALTQLQSFNVSLNAISGSIPSLSGLTSLQNMSLDANSFSGAIPALSGLTSLIGFDVSNNLLSGPIPSLSGLTNLQGLNVSVNKLSGSLPSLTGLSGLQVLDFHGNKLSGTIPALTGLTALQALYAQDNQLSGSIPALSGLTSLQFLNLHDNQLNGTIPALTGLSALKNFDAGANQLSGSLPSLGGLSALNTIDVGGNQLTGFIPAAPNPNSLVAGASVLCGNSYTATANADWDAATGVTPWYSACGLTASTFNLDQHGLTGAWYNPATGGQGFLIETFPDLGGSGQGYLAAGWYTFDVTAAGGQRWYTLQGPAISGAASATLDIFAATGGNFNAPPKVTASKVGTATLSFSDCTNGTLNFNFNDGRTGSIPLIRIDANVTCSNAGDNNNAPSNYLLSGTWYNQATSGQGFFFAVNPLQTLFYAAWYTYVPNGAAIGGGASQRWYTIQDNAFAPGTLSKTGLAIYETTGGTFNTGKVSAGPPVGTVDIVINSCTSITLNYTFNANFLTGVPQTGTVNLSRVVGAPAGCSL